MGQGVEGCLEVTLAADEPLDFDHDVPRISRRLLPRGGIVQIGGLLSELRVLTNPIAVSHVVAEEFLRIGSEAIAARGRFAVALSGGTTPRSAYERIATTWKSVANPLDWSRVYLFWGDERRVSPDDPQSNFRTANETLIHHVPIPQVNVHPMPAAFPEISEGAKLYEERLREFFGPDQSPRFDLILLGMGPDGHVASLFPGSDALDVKD